MNTENSSQRPDPVTSIGLVASLIAAIIWVIYGLTGTPQWLLVVGVVFSMLVGGWWAFGHRFFGGGRERNRDGRRERL